MFAILEIRKSDFEDDEASVNLRLSTTKEEAKRVAMLAVGRACRDAIHDDLVDDPREVWFDFTETNEYDAMVEGPSWSCKCTIWEVESNV